MQVITGEQSPDRPLLGFLDSIVPIYWARDIWRVLQSFWQTDLSNHALSSFYFAEKFATFIFTCAIVWIVTIRKKSFLWRKFTFPVSFKNCEHDKPIKISSWLYKISIWIRSKFTWIVLKFYFDVTTPSSKERSCKQNTVEAFYLIPSISYWSKSCQSKPFCLNRDSL